MNNPVVKYLLEKRATPSLKRIAGALTKREKSLAKIDDQRQTIAAGINNLESPKGPVAKALNKHWADQNSVYNKKLERTEKQVRNIVNLKSRKVDGALELANADRMKTPAMLMNGIDGRL